MQQRPAAPALAALVAALAAWGAAASASHPIERVVGLLEELSAKVEAEGKEEELTYAKFETWCANSIRALDKGVASGKESIEILESKVEGKTKQNKTLTEGIDALTEELDDYEKEQTKADDDRKDAADLYSSAKQDLEDTIAAVGDALTELEGAKSSVSGLVQKKMLKLMQLPLLVMQLSAEQQDAIVSGASRADPKKRPELAAKGDADKHKKKDYNFKSGSVVELLKELKRKFEDDLVELEKEETNSQNAHAVEKLARDNAIDAATTAKEGKETQRGEVQSDLASAKSDLKDVKDDLKADEDTLTTTKTSCSTKKNEWEERSDIRRRERKAIAAAIEILQKVSGVRTEQPENPVPPPSPLASESAASLLQIVDPKARAINLLRAEARRSHSRMFKQFAERVAARIGGPFDDVNQMIQKMIFRLMAEQKDEDDHKNWCDGEIEKTNSSRDAKEEKIENLEAKIKADKAQIALLVEEIADADKTVTDLKAHIDELAEIRTIGKEENKAAIKDAQDAQSAITKAISVIKDFYQDSGKVSDFLQEPVTLPEEPASWGSSYTGVANPKDQPDGIIAVLEEVSTDFSRMEADTKAQEESDQKEYDEERTEVEIELNRRRKESEMKAEKQKRLQGKVDSDGAALKHTETQLESVEQYQKDLTPACLDGDSTYEDRKAARSEEIDALKTAQKTLAEAFKKEKSDGGAFLAPVRPLRF